MGLKAIVLAVLVLLLGGGIVAVVFWQKPIWLFHHQELRNANQIVTRVEAFRANHRRLPNTLHDVGLDDPNQKVFYAKISDDEYCLWFGTALGQSETYRSHEKRWEEGRECR